MGNIETLKRQNSTGTYDMDDISYHYDGAAPSWKNQLLYVDDSKAAALSTKDIDDQSAGNYAYDAIGNLIQDNAEEIQTIAWTVYGKIKSITRTGASTKPNLEFEYNTTGQRVIKRILPNNGDKPVTTFYLRDASGNIMATYKQYLKIIDIPTQAAEERLAVEEWNMYGSSRLGVLSKEELIASRIGVWNGSAFVPNNPATYTINTLPTTDIFDEQVGYKTYELSNHLGNVLATITDRKVPDIDMPTSTYNYYNPQITTITDYYPFGMPIPDKQWNASTGYRFGFNGQEKDNEVSGDGNSLDFGARIYDSRLGRFLSVDNYANHFSSYSSFLYAANNPLFFIDKGGNYKFPVEQQKKHPVLTNILKNLYTYVLSDETLKNAFMEHGAYKNDAEIYEILGWEQGSELRVNYKTLSREETGLRQIRINSRGDAVTEPTLTGEVITTIPPNIINALEEQYKEAIKEIDPSLTGRKLRRAKRRKKKAARGFVSQLEYVTRIILHESVHQGNFLKAKRETGDASNSEEKTEKGFDFENAIGGELDKKSVEDALKPEEESPKE